MICGRSSRLRVRVLLQTATGDGRLLLDQIGGMAGAKLRRPLDITGTMPWQMWSRLEQRNKPICRVELKLWPFRVFLVWLLHSCYPMGNPSNSNACRRF